LGKYSQAVAAVLATFIVVASVALRIVGAITGVDITSLFIDNLALIAMGAVFGAAASTAVNGKAIESAHRRLDQIHAPPSAFLEDQAKEGIPE
jgi:multidrug efflux pump subunit AcrB